MEGWRAGRLDEVEGGRWRGGVVQGWTGGEVEGWRVEGWRDGVVEGWRGRAGVEGWRGGGVEWWSGGPAECACACVRVLALHLVHRQVFPLMAARPESKAAAARLSLPEAKAARRAVAAENLPQHPSNAASPYLDVSHVIKLGLSVWAHLTFQHSNIPTFQTLQSFNPHFQQSSIAGILCQT